MVASLGSVAASGGYYVAVAADQIYANPGTLTGSIGVIMQLANLEGLMKKVGVDYVVVKAGQFKDLGNLARAMTPEERRVLQALLDDVHGQFIGAVADGPQARPRRRSVQLRRRAHLLRRAGQGAEDGRCARRPRGRDRRRRASWPGCRAPPRSSGRGAASRSWTCCGTSSVCGAAAGLCRPRSRVQDAALPDGLRRRANVERPWLLPHGAVNLCSNSS